MAPSRLVAVGFVALGGFLGSIARYGLVVLSPGLGGTFLANVTGSFALGYVFYVATVTETISPRTRLLVGTGFLSSYTTYSTFAFETVAVSPAWGVANVLGSYAVGFGAAAFGRWLALEGSG
ncbi:MAG: CrcB family protein [Halalkalicoccus sp.]